MKKTLTNNEQEMREPYTPAQRIRADWKALMRRISYTGVLTNIPYLAFVSLLVVIYIANSHRAVEMQRELAREQQVLKELRWRYMDAKTRLMNAGMESEIMRTAAPLGLKPLTLPAYSVVVSRSSLEVIVTATTSNNFPTPRHPTIFQP